MYRFAYIAVTILLFLSNYGWSQSDYRDGYIITLEGDTIVGEVNYRLNLKNYESCLFKRQQGVIEYLPTEIKGFGYKKGDFFRSGVIEKEFVEVLIMGDMSLFKAKNQYIVEKEGIFFSLTAKKKEVIQDGQTGYQTSTRWRGTLRYLIKDCLDDTRSATQRVKLDDRNLTSLVIQYNECRKTSFTEYSADKKWVQFDIGMSLSAVRSGLRIKDLNNLAFFLNDNYTVTDISPSLVLMASLPRSFDRVAIQGELQFLQTVYSSLITLNQASMDYYEVYIETNTLSTPIAFNYFFPRKNKMNFHLQSGLDFNFNIQTDTKFLNERVIDQIVTTFPEREVFGVKNIQVGFLGGVGIRRSFEHYSSSLTLRYGRLSRLNTNGGITASPDYFLLQIILFNR